MVCFVILHYMALDETIQCAESILGNVEGEKKIIIADNCSPNGSIANLKERYAETADVDVIGTDSNLGFARGNNFGYKYALSKYDPDFIVVMNNDMEIRQKDFIGQMEQSYREYGFDVLGPDIYSTKKKYHQNPQTRKMPTRQDLERTRRQLEIKNRLQPLISLKWAILSLVHKKPPQECFYPETFMYFEAEILCYQCRRDGEKMIYDPRLRVDHHEDVATDLEYHKQSRKSIFTVKCMLQSVKAFLALMDRDGN